jgi:mannosyltransferase
VACGVPAAVALGLGLWHISARSYNQDEAATLSATRRPLAALLRMLGHIDAVHGAYYVLIHFVVLAFGISETATRFPSVLATALAAGMLAALGTRLAGIRAGVAAGLLYAVSPPAIAYAQDARPFALATALAVISCYCFIGYMEAGGRRRAVGYTVALTVTGWVNIMALLVVVANAVTLLATPAWRARRRGFLIAAGAALAAVFPLMWLDLSQVQQVAWEARPGAAVWLGLLGVSCLSGGLAFVALRPGARGPRGEGPRTDGQGTDGPGPGGPGPDGPARVARLATPWLMLPPVLVAAAAEITPMWELRYVLFCLPALVLLVVAAVSRLPRRAGPVVVAAAVAGMLVALPLVRPPVSGDNLRAVSRLLAARARPGDAVVFPNIGKRLIKDAYPAGFGHVRDVGLDTSPGARNALYGLNVGQEVLYHRLAGVRRLWVIRYPTPHPGRFYGTVFAPHAFCALQTWQIPGNTVTLYRAC